MQMLKSLHGVVQLSTQLRLNLVKMRRVLERFCVRRDPVMCSNE